MTRTASTPWASLLTTGGIVLFSAINAAPAAAAPPCVSGTLISEIVTPPSTGYTCEIGGIIYTFNPSMAELNSSPTAALNFINTPTFQKLIFANLSNEGLIEFSYEINTMTESVVSIEQSYEPDPMLPPPLFPPVGLTGLATIPGLPFPPSPSSLTVEATFEPDTSGNPPFATLTSLTHTIYKTPAPLPMVGAGLAFAFSRKLRRRIHRAS
jgi:hypothetical protein